ncbi:MAG TPA: metallophosphoesterase [Vicinamibacterales bacterium]
MNRAVWIALAVVGAIAPLQRAASDVTGTWEFAIGLRTERLLITADRMPLERQRVELPHRVLEPNTALWYARDLQLPLDAALEVEADDGAQVFVGGRRLANDRQWFRVPADLTGPRHVVIRVLNNAMNGGLRRVAIVAAREIPPADAAAISIPPGFDPVETQEFRNRMPRPAEPCRFSVWADSQGGWTTFARLVTLMTARSPSFSAGIGDLVAHGSDARAWPELVRTLEPLAARAPIVPIAGNHEYDGYYNNLRAELYERWFGRESSTWFAWSCGPARFAAIDVNREFPIGITERSTEWEWLQTETQSGRWKSAAWRILLVHQPPWSRSWAGYDGDASVRRIVEPLVRDRGLDIVLSGHSHAYEHLVRSIDARTLHVLITGGAGGNLESVDAEKLSTEGERIAVRHHFLDATATTSALTFEAIDVDGNSLDRVTLSRDAAPKRDARR